MLLLSDEILRMHAVFVLLSPFVLVVVGTVEVLGVMVTGASVAGDKRR